jgi:acetyltransferase
VDALVANGLSLSNLSQEGRKRLRELLPAVASVINPVDIVASAGPAEFAGCLAILLQEQTVDAVMVILPPPPVGTAVEIAAAIIPIVKAASKPVVIALMGEDLIVHASRLFRQARVPDYRFPERAASVLKVLADRAEYLSRPAERTSAREGVRRSDARHALETAGKSAAGFVDAHAGLRALAAYGIQSPRAVVASDAAGAALAAEEIGFPVVLKVHSVDLPHKSDVGGVKVNLGDSSAVRDGFREMLEKVRSVQTDARIDGVMVQAMAPEGQEVIVGAVRDPQFGPLIMFGSGGVEVEGMRDVAFALAPLTPSEAEAMVDATWAGKRMRGYRSVPPGDREAVLDCILRLSQLMVDVPEIAEVDINPLRVYPQGRGATALDVLIRVS